MKQPLIILLLFWCTIVAAQQKTVSFAAIDDRVSSIKPAPSALLAKQLTEPYATDREKVRAIFSWIAQHVTYHVKPKKYLHRSSTAATNPVVLPEPAPDMSANDIVAENVLNSLSAICEGYSRLFKTLCDHAGIRAEIITGYAKSNMDRAVFKFRSNHYWNAVMIDSVWQLIDATWASGYISYRGDEFIPHFDDSYFFTPPPLFLQEHFPDDLSWTLLSQVPMVQEFKKTPFRPRAYSKYHISSYSPDNGIIEASVGDTLHFQLETTDAEADKRIARDTLLAFDSSAIEENNNILYVKPETGKDHHVFNASVKVEPTNAEWVQVVYNNDIILRYRLNIRKEKSSLAARQ